MGNGAKLPAPPFTMLVWDAAVLVPSDVHMPPAEAPRADGDVMPVARASAVRANHQAGALAHGISSTPMYRSASVR